MKITISYENEQIHLKKDGQIVAIICDDEDASEVLQTLMSLYLHIFDEECSACSDGKEVSVIQKEHYNRLLDSIEEYRRLYVVSPPRA